MDAEFEDCNMYSGTEDEEEDEEITALEKAAREGLQDGSLNLSGTEENTFRCPFCPGKRKKSYDHASLLAHATGQGRGMVQKAVGYAARHRALARHLTEDLAAQPAARRPLLLQQEPPCRAAEDKAMVYPWAGLLLNVKSVEAPDGRRSGPGVGELKRQFKHFRPTRVEVGYDTCTGYQGWALLTFAGNDAGYENAKAFDRSFLELNRGRKEWMSKREADNLGADLYGWMATEEDKGPDTDFGSFLVKKMVDLKTQDEYLQQRRRMEEQKYRSLAVKFDMQAQEVEKIKREAEVAMMQLKQQHKEELEGHKAAANSKRLVHQEVVQKRVVQLDEELAALTTRCTELSLKESSDDTENKMHDLEKHENELKIRIIAGEAEIHQKFRMEQLVMLEKHEGQSRQLEKTLQAYKIRLHEKQIREMELLQLLERLETAQQNQDKNHDELTELLEEDMKQLGERERASKDELQNVETVVEELMTQDDGNLARLRSELGDKVAQSVFQTLQEMSRYNPNGHYSANVPWRWTDSEDKLAGICQVFLDCVKVEAEAKNQLLNDKKELQEALEMAGVTRTGEAGWVNGKRIRA